MARKTPHEIAMMFAREWGGGDRETETTIWHAVRAAIIYDRDNREEN